MIPNWLLSETLNSTILPERAPISDAIIVSIIATFGVVTAAVLAYLGAKRSSDMARVGAVETRLLEAESRLADTSQELHATNQANAAIWAYALSLKSHIDAGNPPPPPEPPEWLSRRFN